MSKLKTSFYLHNNVTEIAKSLIGKKLCTHIDNEFTSGIIIETEAYQAPEDMASHAYNNKKTKRTLPFFLRGGITYVYLIYGVYNLFNVITNVVNVPHAILIRAVHPKEGIDVMMKRHNNKKRLHKITSGPGLLSIALGINISHNMMDLQGNKIWIEDTGFIPESASIIQTKRIGITIPEPWKSKPWRYCLKGNPWLSE